MHSKKNLQYHSTEILMLRCIFNEFGGLSNGLSSLAYNFMLLNPFDFNFEYRSR